jgi:predicted dehydrogenase
MASKKQLTRREVLTGAIATAGAFTILPSRALGRAGFTSPNDKANVAFIGIGNYGGAAIDNLMTENVVGLCDVDWRVPASGRGGNGALARAQKFPQAKVYNDFRQMLEEMDQQIDAVCVSTADHTHAVAAIMAMKMGKHTCCEKPLAHNVDEVRAMMAAARKYPQLNTQTGIQGHNSYDVRDIVEWVQDGAIGTVKELHIFQARAVGGTGINAPGAGRPGGGGAPGGPGAPRAAGAPNAAPRQRRSIYEQIADVTAVTSEPPDLHWDLWVGPAPMRNYNPMYLPERWRNWVDFGTWILGDHGPHFIDPVFWALNLGFPDTIQAETDDGYDPAKNAQTWPQWGRVHYTFPAKGSRPALKMTWYGQGDGPTIPEDWDNNVKFPDGGGIIVGTKGQIVYGPVYGSPVDKPKQVWLLPAELDKSYTRPQPRLARGVSIWQEWIQGAKSGKQASSNWAYGGPLTQICLLGDCAIRNKGKLLRYDEKRGKFTNSEEANALFSRVARVGWELPAI